MKSKVFLDVYPDKEFCSDTIEWSHFDRCQFLDMSEHWSQPSCKVHRRKLNLMYFDNPDPDIEGHKVLKHSLCKASLTIHDDQSDKLFITELINDLHRNGFVRGGKAETMLHDWSRELKHRASTKHPASRLRKTFNLIVGKENW